MANKNLTTSYKVVKLLKMLIKEPLRMPEILSGLEKEGIFINKETISKYFTTLRRAGCKVQKQRGKYHVQFPILNLNEGETKALASFQMACESLMPKRTSDILYIFLIKLSALTLSENVENYKRIISELRKDENFWTTKLSKKYKKKIELISPYIGENPQKLILTASGKNMTVIPLNFIFNKTSVSILCCNIKTGKNQKILLDKIEEIKHLPEKTSLLDFALSTTFKLTNRLKDAYTLKEGETASLDKNSLIVTNNRQDKEELLNRLLRYGTSCEILYPKNDREKFIKMVENLISKKL